MLTLTPLFKAKLVPLANAPTPNLTIYHLEQNVTASCFRRLSTGLAESEPPT